MQKRAYTSDINVALVNERDRARFIVGESRDAESKRVHALLGARALSERFYS